MLVIGVPFGARDWSVFGDFEDRVGHEPVRFAVHRVGSFGAGEPQQGRRSSRPFRPPSNGDSRRCGVLGWLDRPRGPWPLRHRQRPTPPSMLCTSMYRVIAILLRFRDGSGDHHPHHAPRQPPTHRENSLNQVPGSLIGRMEERNDGPRAAQSKRGRQCLGPPVTGADSHHRAVLAGAGPPGAQEHHRDQGHLRSPMAAYEVRTWWGNGAGIALVWSRLTACQPLGRMRQRRDQAVGARVAHCLARSTNKRASLEIVHLHWLRAVDRLAADLM